MTVSTLFLFVLTFYPELFFKDGLVELKSVSLIFLGFLLIFKLFFFYYHFYYLQKNHQKQMTRLERTALFGTVSLGVVHEVINPLQIIGMAANQMKTDLNLGEFGKIEKYNNDILRSFDLAVNVVKNVNSISTGLYHGQKSEKTDLNKFSKSVLSFCKKRLSKRNITNIEYEVIGDNVWDFPVGLIQQVMINLIHNASDAIYSQKEKWIKIIFIKEESFGLIKVIDSGKCILKSNLDYIFDMNFTTKDESGGKGLGLSISRKLLRNIGGDLFYSEYNGHTCFTIKVKL